MKRRLLPLYATLSLLLAACVVVDDGGGGNGGDPARDVSNDPNQVVASGSLSPGSTAQIPLRLSSSQVAQQAIYFELDTELDLLVYDSSGSLFATSSSSDFFAAGTAGLSSAAFRPSALRSNVSCRGSCVIADANQSRFTVRVRNSSSSVRSFSLYAFVDRYEDEGEFENDAPGNAVVVQMGESNSERGAIESIGDVDHYRPASHGRLTFATEATVNVVATILPSGGGDPIAVSTDTPIEVFSDDIIRVRVEGGDAAAPSANSLYFLTLRAP